MAERGGEMECSIWGTFADFGLSGDTNATNGLIIASIRKSLFVNHHPSPLL